MMLGFQEGLVDEMVHEVFPPRDDTMKVFNGHQSEFRFCVCEEIGPG